ncbi:hypothetical protein QBC38DRAFT_185102 [Podospora fimiseda]|uniref:Uncharacterized protein n=1 Tax=Podospora fimiseda TaxID=252190 RepID=A0AAN7BQP6_9PEZI|nr:hypothetical protein QBC38DRAFT_185102 [Podospora fimiseda]
MEVSASSFLELCVSPLLITTATASIHPFITTQFAIVLITPPFHRRRTAGYGQSSHLKTNRTLKFEKGIIRPTGPQLWNRREQPSCLDTLTLSSRLSDAIQRPLRQIAQSFHQPP